MALRSRGAGVARLVMAALLVGVFLGAGSAKAKPEEGRYVPRWTEQALVEAELSTWYLAKGALQDEEDALVQALLHVVRTEPTGRVRSWRTTHRRDRAVRLLAQLRHPDATAWCLEHLQYRGSTWSRNMGKQEFESQPVWYTLVERRAGLLDDVVAYASEGERDDETLARIAALLRAAVGHDTARAHFAHRVPRLARRHPTLQPNIDRLVALFGE